MLEDRALHGAENTCRFDKVNVNEKRYIIEAACQGGGLPAEAWGFAIEMAGADAMTLTHSGEEPIRYRRCQPNSGR